MKVAMVSPEKLPVPPVLGGAIAQTLFETAVSVRDPELTVISPWAEALNGSEIGPAGVFYHVDTEAQAARVRGALGDPMPLFLRNPKVARRFYYLNGVTDLLLNIAPDVIQVHNSPEFVSYLLKQFPGKRMVLYMHSEPSAQFYSTIRMDLLVQRIDTLVFVSRYLARQFISLYPGWESKISVVHNSIDTDIWHPGLKGEGRTEKIRQRYGLSPGRTVLFVGRTVPRKGLHCLLRAMDLVRCRLPGAKLLVVGSPFFGVALGDPFLRDFQRRALRLGEGVVFTGYVDHSRTPYFYAAADVTVVPSVSSEGLPKVVIESMACGVPVIGSRQGGIPEIMDDGINGVLVGDPRDVGGLAGQIVRLLRDSGRRKEMGAAARRRAVERFSTPVRMKRIREFYKALEKGGRMQQAREMDGRTVPGV